MANTFTSLKLSYDAAFDYRNEIFSLEQVHTKYVFIGNNVPYANSDNTIPDIVDTALQEKDIWDNIYAAVKVTGNDVELVIPRVNWTANTVYREYDDTVTLNTLLSANTVSGIEPMYVYTTDGNVYKCLSNNLGAESTIMPIGDFTTSNGYITTADDYLWKYMYSVQKSNKFISDEWIPAISDADNIEYNTNSDYIIPSELAKIVVIDGGTNYRHTTMNATAYTVATSNIFVNDPTNVAVGMVITGVGIPTGTHITDVNLGQSKISLSAATIGPGGGSGNTVTVTTRAVVFGQGNEDYVTSVSLSNSAVEKITVTSIGSNYLRANVAIYGTGSGATARAVLGPRFGHGYNSAKELGAVNLMIAKKIGQSDSTEGGVISTNTSFRQYGLLSGPYKYGQNTKVVFANANSVISQTYNLTLVPGAEYTLNEVVYQGNSFPNATFTGVVHASNSDFNLVRLTNVKGVIRPGILLTGNTSTITRSVVSFTTPEFEPYSGDIHYVQNAAKVTRTDGQAENIKFVIKF